MKNKKIQLFNRYNCIGFILVMIAGWVDIIGLKLLVLQRSSFMTGRAALLGEALFSGDFGQVIMMAIIVFAFILGAYVGTKISLKFGFKWGLIATSFLIVLCAIIIAFNDKILTDKDITAMLLPMAMGCQNATTSLTKIGRTTHLTGPSTDIGINLAKKHYNLVVFWGLRWIGFPIGAMIGLQVIYLCEKHVLPLYYVFVIPALILVIVALLQEKYMKIDIVSH